MDLMEYLKQKRKIIDAALDGYLPPETEVPTTIHRAMRYSVFAGGKRLRPILAMISFELVGGRRREKILPAACALELIHTYSIIHDDLPCMDDDDLRRGKPTLHKVFGQGIAVLAGDALHDAAFELLAKTGNIAIIAEAVDAIGTRGMVGGQVADIEAEGRDVSPADLEYIHTHKTGALFRLSLRMGALLGGAGPRQLASLTRYGERLGLAFQIVDDVLDVEGTEETVGKPIGADEARRKATYPALFGLVDSKRRARQVAEEARGAVKTLGSRGDILRQLVDFIVTRTH